MYLNLGSTAVDVDLATRQVTPHDTLPAGEPLVVEGDHAIVVSGEMDVEGSTVAWTRRGGLLRLTDEEVSVCDPGSGACSSTPLEVAPDNPVLGDTINW